MRRIKKRHAAVGLFVTGVMTIGSGFLLESTASADGVFANWQDYDLHLKGSHHGATWASKRGSSSECNGAVTPEGFPYLWHFVVPDYSAANNALPDVTAVYTAFNGAGNVNSGQVVQKGKGWDVYTSQAGTLLDAVGDSTATHETPLVMNLSHTCGPTGQSSSSSVSSSEESSSEESSSSESSSSVSSSSQSSESSVSSSSTSQTSSSQSSVSSSSTSQTSSSQSSESSVSSSSTSQTSSSQSSESSVSSSSTSQSSSDESSVSSSSTSRTTSSTPSSSVSDSSEVSSSSEETSSEDSSSESSPIVSGSQSSNVPTSQATSSPTVSGVQVLPQTGIDPGFLLMLGGMLVISGVLLMRYSNDPT